MDGLWVELVLAAVGAMMTWLLIRASQWSRRPRLHLCLDQEEVPREWDVGEEVVQRDLVLSVRNVGLSPAVDCVGRLERFELSQDGEWEEAHYTAADLAWRGTGGARAATAPSDAPPRQLRLLRFTKYYNEPLRAFLCYADRSDAPPVPPDLESDTGLVGPNRFRFTVWVQPESEAGVSASCTVEIDWRRSSEGDERREYLTIDADPICGESPGRMEQLVRAMTRRIGG